jgi:hypothetical protein
MTDHRLFADADLVAMLSASGYVVLSPNVLRDFLDDPTGMIEQIRAIKMINDSNTADYVAALSKQKEQECGT